MTTGKPDDIPQDVWDIAWKLQGNTEYDEAALRGASSAALLQACENDSEAIARAILAATEVEREACAVEAEKGQWEHRSDTPFSAGYAVWVGPRGPDIAAAIRKRGEVNTAHKNSEEV